VPVKCAKPPVGQYHGADDITCLASSRYRGAMRAEVEQVIEVIRPAIQADKSDIHLRDVDEETGLVSVELVGACVTWPASSQTLKVGIERILKDRVEGVTELINVGESLEEISEIAVSL
jgi:Fe-S cluster biogenesis protein NfuA